MDANGSTPLPDECHFCAYKNCKVLLIVSKRTYCDTHYHRLKMRQASAEAKATKRARQSVRFCVKRFPYMGGACIASTPPAIYPHTLPRL
jgi:hypothetical protein